MKCHACYNVTAEIGRIFCPKCGNGGTLRKVAVTVGENGVVLAARKPRITLRGTKVSISDRCPSELSKISFTLLIIFLNGHVLIYIRS